MLYASLFASDDSNLTGRLTKISGVRKGLVERNVTRRGVHRRIGSLESSVRNFLKAHNSAPKPFAWTKLVDTILENLRFYCEDACATREQRIFRQMSRTYQSPHYDFQLYTARTPTVDSGPSARVPR